ncbi:LPS assembly lipoprotein LptE [Gracilimonas sp.]|uniref:LPS assembly lipoprotein LptE n=1 Tax=Gracilimonas sp. TaxID=1974203 RepID=UPI002870E04C|nr:LptE family protein [Gracilimonas sp.]
MGWTKTSIAFILCIGLMMGGCIRYSFTGASIPPGVNSVYIPFFPDQSNSGLGDLSNRLNEALINRFVNQSKLQLANNEEEADAVLDGTIASYSNRPFSIGGNEQANENQVSITVRATFLYTAEDEPEWSTSFTGTANYDPTTDPIEGENNAANTALEQVANNMFNDAVSNW